MSKITFKEYFISEKEYDSEDLQDILELMYTKNGQLNQENIDKMKQAVIKANRKLKFKIGFEINTLGGWYDKTISQWEKNTGSYKFSIDVKTLEAMARQIEEFTNGEKIWRKTIVFTDLIGNKTKTPSDFIVYKNDSDLQKALKFLKEQGKEVQIEEMKGSVKSTAIQIGNFIIQDASVTGGRTASELSIVTKSFFKNSTRKIK